MELRRGRGCRNLGSRANPPSTTYRTPRPSAFAPPLPPWSSPPSTTYGTPPPLAYAAPSTSFYQRLVLISSMGGSTRNTIPILNNGSQGFTPPYMMDSRQIDF